MVIKYTTKELIAIGELVTLRECISPPDQAASTDEFVVTSTDGGHINQAVYCDLQRQNEANFAQDILPKLFFLQSQFQNLFLESHHQQQQQHTECIQYHQHQNQHQQSQEPLTQSVADFFKKAQQNFHLSHTSRIDPFKVRTLSEVEADLIGGQGGHY